MTSAFCQKWFLKARVFFVQTNKQTNKHKQTKKKNAYNFLHLGTYDLA